MSTPLAITGLGCLSRLGAGVDAHLHAFAKAPGPFAPLACLADAPPGFETTLAGWIEPRLLLCHRKWSPSSRAAIEVARQAVGDAGWSAGQRADAAVFFGTSRGSAAGWLQDWPGRRPFARMAASNSLPAEPAAAVCQELGIAGPWQVLSSGCCAGLDALGMAALWLRAGRARRALVVAVDLPLAAAVLESYRRTGLLATTAVTGLVPAEGAAALCLEVDGAGSTPGLVDYLTASEPGDPLGAAPSGVLAALLGEASRGGRPEAVVPHASGTPASAGREPQAIREALGPEPSLHPLKPWTGHTIGASGLLETVVTCAFLRGGRLPPSTGPDRVPSLPPAARLFKLASAMGGKHSLVILQSPP